MSQSPQAQVRDALDELVNQFSDPMAFLRELIQNAIDAGTEEVEVAVSFKPSADDRGVTIVAINDWGEGMTREIIDKRLTRLFSSAKDGDQTKIGKFGIGFVSVFAIEPNAVCIDTAREGESWRVLFEADRTYKLFARDEPVDGTKIQVIKETSRTEHEEILKRAAEVLRYWCKHVQTEILFQGDPIAEPFGVADATLSVEHNDGFSHIVVAHHPRGGSLAGFYNGGLTLIETSDEARVGYAYKINSPHLEHTLTRDAVIRDEGYDRVIAQVQTMIEGPLLDATLAKLEALTPDAAPSEVTATFAALTRHAADGHLAQGLASAFIARDAKGESVTLAGVRGRHKDGIVLISPGPTPLATRLAEAGYTVLLDPLPREAGSAHPETPSLLAALLPLIVPEVEIVGVDQRFFLALGQDMTAPEQALCAAVRAAFDADGIKIDRVQLAALAYPGSAVAERAAVMVDAFDQPARLEQLDALPRGMLAARRCLAINADHPIVAPLQHLARTEPELAAYLLSKHFFLNSGLDAALDSRLADGAVEARWIRLKNS